MSSLLQPTTEALVFNYLAMPVKGDENQENYFSICTIIIDGVSINTQFISCFCIIKFYWNKLDIPLHYESKFTLMVLLRIIIIIIIILLLHKHVLPSSSRIIP